MADAFTLKAIISAVDKLTPTLKVIEAQAKSVRKYIGDLGGAINSLAGKFGLGASIFTGIAAGFSLGAIKQAVVGYTELGEEVIKGSYKAGMSTDQWQRYRYVAEQAGMQSEVLGMSMGKLNKNVAAAAMGKNQALVDLFRQLKIPMRDVNGQIRDGADMLPQLAQAFALNQDPIKQAALGTALFGKSYQEMLPFLNEGSEGIEKSLARFAGLKGVIPREDLEGAKEFGDKLSDLQFVLKGFQMTVARELVPVLSPMVEQFVQWAAANKKLIGAEVKKIVQDLVSAAKSVDWAAFVQGVRDTMHAARGFVDKVGGMRNVLIALVLYMNANAIGSALGLAGALGRLGLSAGGAAVGGIARLLPLLRGLSFAGLAASLGGVLVAAWPVVLVVGALAAAAYLVWRNWDVVGPALGQVWERVKAAATVAWNVLRFLWSWSPMGIVVDNWGAVSGWLGAFWEGLKTAANVAWNVVRFLWSWSPMGIVVNNWGVITGWLGTFWESLKGIVSEGASAVANTLQSWGVLDAVKAVWEPVLEFFRGVWNVIGKIIEPVVRAAGDAGRAVGGYVDGQFGEGANQQAYGPRFDGPSPALASAAPIALNGPSQTTTNSKVEVSFKDAPPGMRVEQAKTDSARTTVNTNVGYRYTAAMGY